MITQFLKSVFQENIYILIFVICLCMLFIKYLEPQLIIALLLLVFIIVNHKELYDFIKTKEHKTIKQTKIIDDNSRSTNDLQWNEDIKQIIQELKQFKKYNPNAYGSGYKNIRMYTYLINDLSRDDIHHHNPYFDRAYQYFKESVNHFQSMGISVPEENTIQAIKYNKLTTMKLATRISELCKELHQTCYHELFNLSLRLDESWSKQPTTYTKGIHMNDQGIEEYVKDYDTRWSLY